MVIGVVIEGAWGQLSDLIEVGLHDAAIGHAKDYTLETPSETTTGIRLNSTPIRLHSGG